METQKLLTANQAKKIVLMNRDLQFLPKAFASISKKIELQAKMGNREITYIRSKHKYIKNQVRSNMKLLQKALIKNGYKVKWVDSPKYDHFTLEISW